MPSRRPPTAPLGTARGQASVELVAVLPLLGLLFAIALQAVLYGWASWAAADAARAGARAHALGERPAPAARRALPGALGTGLRVDERDRSVTVRVRVPRALPISVGVVSATAGMVPQ